MKKVKPFEPQEKGYMIIDNAVFDIIMPSLNPTTWKVLCFIMRKTEGWNKEWDGISYSQIMKGTKIRSSATVSKALKELLDINYIRCVKAKDQWDSNQYALNTALEIEVGSIPTSKNEAVPTSKNEAMPTSKNEDTIIHDKEQKKDNKMPKEFSDFFPSDSDHPVAGLPTATDGHQRAVDNAHGAKVDSVTEVAKHLRWLCAGYGTPLPHGQPGRTYLKAARALLDNTDAADWRGVCTAIDDWSENPSEEDKWRRERTKDPNYATDHITAHYWARRNGGKSNGNNSGRSQDGSSTLTDQHREIAARYSRKDV